MNKSLNHQFRQNIIIISIIITTVFLIINISLYIINNNYLLNKVEEENNAFLEITTHMMNENEIPIALEYVEHYTHIHEVNIEILDDNNEMLFSSNLSHRYTTRYTIETLKGSFTIFMDNTDSITVNRIETNTLYVNVSLIIIYVLSLFVLFQINKRNSKQISKDIRSILDLVENENTSIREFNHTEFNNIYKAVTSYLENIDMLTEQKEMNMKGLAHDIKTPLTLIYSYFERVQRNELISEQERKIAFDSSKRINELLYDLIENKVRPNNKRINLSIVLSDKIKEHRLIFANKNIDIKDEIHTSIYINWNERNLARVLDNMISNAYYYSKENSEFVVKLEKKDRVMLSFTSSPQNIDDVHPNHIFKKGYRGVSSDEVNRYGKGYGLYLVRIMLNSIGGKIEVKKNKNNVEFTIIL